LSGQKGLKAWLPGHYTSPFFDLWPNLVYNRGCVVVK